MTMNDPGAIGSPDDMSKAQGRLEDFPEPPVRVQCLAAPDSRAVHLTFSRKIDTLAMPAKDARALGRALIGLARTAAGVQEGKRRKSD